eukprot:jgi/Phyca11/109476/e_gw1.16.756.1
MLLSSHQQAAQRDANRMRQRRRTLRTLIGVVGAVALFVGCIAAVDVVAMNGGEPMTLEVTTMSNEEAMAMEAQFGWSSIGYGWCSMRASTYCMFSKDKEKCKNGFECYRNRSESKSEGGNGSGSGDFGNVTVGDAEVGSHLSSSDGTVEYPTEPLGEEEEDYGEEEGGEEHAEEVPQMGGED